MSLLARLAASEAVAANPLLAADPRTALVVATSRGPADHWLDAEADAAPDPSADAFGLAAVAADLARHLGHGLGPRLTLSGACASGLHALIRAALLLEHGDADRAVVIAAESSLHPLFLQSFRRLGVLPPEGARCRPFDVNRAGFLCAEAAAAVVLERVADPKPGDVAVDRYAFAGDAAHLTGSDPTGATLRRVLARAVGARAVDGGTIDDTAGSERPVDVVHAHGTGTEANDAAEAAAIDAVLPPADLRPADLQLADRSSQDPLPSVYSHKGAIGHTVGAAGLTAVVLNALMHRDNVVPPNVGVETPIPLARATIARDAVRRPVRRSVAIAAGFGGATAAVGLRTI